MSRDWHKQLKMTKINGDIFQYKFHVYITKILIFFYVASVRNMKNEKKLDDFALKLEIIRSEKAFNS